MELNPALPKHKPKSSGSRRSKIMQVDGYEFAVDETLPTGEQKLNLTPIPVKCGQPSSKVDMLRLQTEYTTYLQGMHRAGLNPLSIREVMGEEKVDQFSQQYTQVRDANDVADQSSLTSSDILRHIQKLREEQARTRPEDVVPKLAAKLIKTWSKGPTPSRELDRVLGDMSQTVANHLRENNRPELGWRPYEDPAAH